MAVAVEVYRSYLGGLSSDPVWVRVFDIDAPPQIALFPPPANLPAFSDSFPDDSTLLVDQIDLLERRAPNITRVGVAYRRVTFEGQNITRTVEHPSGPFVVDTFTTVGEALSVPRIIKISDAIGGNFLEFQQYSQTILRPSTLMTRTVHAESFDQSMQAMIDGMIDWIHGDLVALPRRARFIGAQVDRIGNRLWRIQYQWKIQSPVLPINSPALSIPGGEYLATLLPVTNSQNPSGTPDLPTPGSFPPHSVPLILIPQIIDQGAFQFGQDPIYYPDRTFPFETSYEFLPGLAGT